MMITPAVFVKVNPAEPSFERRSSSTAASKNSPDDFCPSQLHSFAHEIWCIQSTSTDPGDFFYGPPGRMASSAQNSNEWHKLRGIFHGTGLCKLQGWLPRHQTYQISVNNIINKYLCSAEVHAVRMEPSSRSAVAKSPFDVFPTRFSSLSSPSSTSGSSCPWGPRGPLAPPKCTHTAGCPQRRFRSPNISLERLHNTVCSRRFLGCRRVPEPDAAPSRRGWVWPRGLPGS